MGPPAVRSLETVMSLALPALPRVMAAWLLPKDQRSLKSVSAWVSVPRKKLVPSGWMVSGPLPRRRR